MSTLPQPDDRELIQMMAAQMVVMDNHDELKDEYKANILELSDEYEIEFDEERVERDLG